MQLNCMKSTKEFYHLPFYLILLPCSECPLDRKQKKKKKNTVTISDGYGGKMGYKENAVNC